MNKKTLILASALLVLCGTGAFAQKQSKNGGISAEMLTEIRKGYEGTASDKAVRNALNAAAINVLAANSENIAMIDTHFSDEVKTKGRTNQKSSGRCWLFTGLNVLRSRMIDKYDLGAFTFSQNYVFFYDQLEKANLMLQGVVDCAKKSMDDTRVQFFFKNPLNDGGTFCGVSDLAGKYGLVPKSVQPETFSAENTSRMSALVSSKLREFGLELRQMVADGKKPAAIKERKTQMLATVYHMLCLTLGEPVSEFDYAFRDKDGKQVGEVRHYTPRQFYDATVGRQLNGTFIMVMNDPRRPYHKTYEVEYDRHTYDGHNWKYLNLPTDEIAQLAIASLKDGRKMYSSYDVGKQFDRKRGYLDTANYDYGTLFGTTFGMDKAQRIATFDSGSTHAMTLTAVDLDADGKPVKWKVENSWGPSYGQAGCLIMTNRWFGEYMFRLVVDKAYVSDALLKEYEQKPVMVMPEDPLFGVDD